MIEVKNRKTGRSYMISEEAWKTIKANGKADKYIYVGESKILQVKQKVQPPAEVVVIKEKHKNKENA